jgi:hypothetical protein
VAMTLERSLIMVMTRAAAVAMVGVGLAASGVLLSQSWSGAPASPSAPVTTAATSMPLDEVVVRAADKAVLVQLCVDGLGDPEANAYYQRARAAVPSLAEGIGADCRLDSSAP